MNPNSAEAWFYWWRWFLVGLFCGPVFFIGLLFAPPKPECSGFEQVIAAGRLLGSVVEQTEHHRAFASTEDLEWLDSNRQSVTETYEFDYEGPLWDRSRSIGVEFDSGLRLIIDLECADGRPRCRFRKAGD